MIGYATYPRYLPSNLCYSVGIELGGENDDGKKVRIKLSSFTKTCVNLNAIKCNMRGIPAMSVAFCHSHGILIQEILRMRLVFPNGAPFTVAVRCLANCTVTVSERFCQEKTCNVG